MTPAPANAGAWIAPENGQFIWNEFLGERDGGYYGESSIYLEKPVAENVAIVAAPWVALDPPSYMLDDLRWEVTLAGKWVAHRGERTVMALQGGAVWISDPPPGCAETQAEVRWLGGRSIGERSFANLEAAERIGDEDCGGQRIDLTLGHRFEERWLGMAQVFVDEPRLGEGTVKTQISLVRFTSSGRGWQVGFRARVDGEALEPALVLGFWGRGDR